MIRFLTLFTLLFFLAKCSDHERIVQTDLQKMELNGMVKTLTITTMNPLSFEMGPLLSSSETQYEFDRLGYLTSEKHYLNDMDKGTKTVTFQRIFTKRNRDSVINKLIVGTNEVELDEFIVKGESGLPIEAVIIYSNDKSINQRESFGYNKKGQKIIAELYTGNGFKISVDSIVYNEKGFVSNIVTTNYKQEDGSSYITNRQFVYDDKGNLVNQQQIEGGDKTRIENTQYFGYEFDSQKNWIKRSTRTDIGGRERTPIETVRNFVYYQKL